MTAIPFDVNDEKLRKTFFDLHIADCMADLTEHAHPLWGKMTPQHMIEHLVWTFECSTGRLELPCRTPENLIERVKRILYDTRPLPHDYKNPLLGEDLPPCRFSTLTDAKAALLEEIFRFIDHFHKQPDAVHVHPIFGPLGAEEWYRAHFKHCYHHLQQFGLIGQFGNILS
jgi:oxepin-CoA hydrolase/3-oxo-5,6-dehydrosuberyl-CoA semialdehyde dehydrogenase